MSGMFSTHFLLFPGTKSKGFYQPSGLVCDLPIG
jgi:hypothetical protein